MQCEGSRRITMPRLNNMVLAGMATAGIALLPSAPAAAAGPLFLAPWAWGHIVAPLILGAAASLTSPVSYPPAPGYYGGSPAYAAPYGYAPQPGYYTPPPAYYPRAYYAPSRYGPAISRPYPSPRAAYPQHMPYHASYGGHEAYRSGGFSHYHR
jgi:hypothetical protein